MKVKTIYSVGWYIFIGCFSVWLICGLNYKFLFNDAVEQSRMELTQALNTAFPREYYIIDGEPYDSNRRNLISIGRSIDIKQDLQHMDIKSIKPLSGNWELVDQNENRFVYENPSYRIYVTKNTKDNGYIVVLTRNNWLELLHL
ncbi:hypothetical protein [Veillonella infantium]|jgi:hypothetical protein|uniref:Lipoprotein n=1 Tax=Veillonella infantium TaxID=1911679 RepID=A0ABX5C3L4_9FIRM|nr:hypothetical protein [Veillonella infantium]PQL57958.1 hypothetical protein VCHSUH03_04025 [Veillonella infantium]